MAVKVVDDLVTGVETELVQLGHEVVVTEVGTSGVHIVTAVVESGLIVRIDGATVLAGHANSKTSVSSRQGSLGFFISLIEVLDGSDTLLRDVEVLLAGNCGEESGDGENRV